MVSPRQTAGVPEMKPIARLLALFVLLAAAPLAAQSSYSGLYVFGDSLVDSGNANIATGGVEAPAIDGYFFGRFSNGPNFADYLSLGLVGTPATPALAGGTNIGVGGATTQFFPGAASPSFPEQIALFGTLGQPIPSDALVLVAFGGNDVRRTIFTGGTIDFTTANADFATGLGLLYASGARNFLITGSADIGLLPRSVNDAGAIPGRLGELTTRSQDISRLFRSTSGAFSTLPGAEVTYFNLFAFEHAVRANPAAFGLPASLNVTDPCQILGAGGPQIANCAGSLFFDPVHPTTIAHQTIAGAMLARLAQRPGSIPEPATWLMLIAGFAVLGARLRKARAPAPRAA